MTTIGTGKTFRVRPPFCRNSSDFNINDVFQVASDGSLDGSAIILLFIFIIIA
jgi:hypothetical protein